MRNFLFLICSFFLVSCANTVETATDESLDGEYRVTEIIGDTDLTGDIIFSFNALGNRVSGNTGCNEFSAHYSQQGKNLEFSTPMNTRKYCEGKMEIESEILSYFERASRLDRSGNKIIIISKDNEPLMRLIKID